MQTIEPELPSTIVFDDAEAAVDHAARLYETGTAHLRHWMQAFVAGETPAARVRAFYPRVRIRTSTFARSDSRLAYGFVSGPGCFETSLTRPRLFGAYYREQLQLLMRNHSVAVEIGASRQPIPVHFAFDEHDYVDGTLDVARRRALRDHFDLPDLAAIDDGIANGTFEAAAGEPQPLALFTAPRVDYSLHRLRHYTGTAPHHFQNFVLFTNYAFYIDEFVRIGRALMNSPPGGSARSGLEAVDGIDGDAYTAFVEPGNVITRRAGTPCEPQDARAAAPLRPPQMAAYHLVRPDRGGITMVNIGVGPSNAKTITDHIAVLRPHSWIMLGHCAGLRTTQQLGDYVLAHGYVREDHVLDEELPLWVPIPALAEVQIALEGAVEDVTRLADYELKRVMRTGTVASTDNRNWELLPTQNVVSTPDRRFSQSRAIALDMESATIAANGFRFRVPYGTLLCVSDKPLHGDLKLPGMANRFYRERVEQHLRIGLRAVERLRDSGVDRLHSRKLRSFSEVAFQ